MVTHQIGNLLSDPPTATHLVQVEMGHPVQVMRRENRNGFKAGGLVHGLNRVEGQGERWRSSEQQALGAGNTRGVWGGWGRILMKFLALAVLNNEL